MKGDGYVLGKISMVSLSQPQLNEFGGPKIEEVSTIAESGDQSCGNQGSRVVGVSRVAG